MSNELRPRIALGVLLAILAAAIWLLAGSEAPPVGGTSVPAADAVAVAEAARAGSLGPDDPRAEGVSRSPVAADAAAADDERAATAGPPVHLRVLLRVVDEEGEERAPADCEGWLVRAQSWIRETGEVFPHEARADARGVAEFRFPGFVHVDWVSCAPPVASGLGFSQISEHHDFDAGSEEEWTLPMLAGGGARGLVLQLDGTPAAGAIVHAYDPSWPTEFDTWTPGFVSARTGADGVFAFDALGAGSWCFAVEPGEWLQLDPVYGDAGEGRGWADVAAGSVADAGVLRVAGAWEQLIRVTDAEGDGVAGVYFDLVALEFASAGLRASDDLVPFEDPAEDWLERFLAGEDPERWLAPPDPTSDDALEYPYDGYARTTGADGVCRWRLPRGDYRVECWSTLPGLPSDYFADRVLSAPSPPLEIRLPVACRPWSGTVVNEEGMPIEGVVLNLSWTLSDAVDGRDAESDAQGRFCFADVPGVRECNLSVAGGEYMPATWTVSPLESPARPFCLLRGETILLRFVGPPESPLELDGLHAQIRPLRIERRSGPPGALVGEAQAIRVENLYVNHRRARSSGLAAGEYEVLLSLPYYFHAAPSLVWGSVLSEVVESASPQEIGRWTVRTGAGEQVLRLDAEQAALIAPPSRLLRGRVLAADSGLPLRASVAASGSGVRAAVQTGADGRFELTVAATRLTLRAEAPGFASAELDPAASDAGGELEFRLESVGALVELRLLDRDGRRLPPCVVTVRPPEAPEQRDGGFQDLPVSDGQVSFYTKEIGRHRAVLSFAEGVVAQGVFEIARDRGKVAVDCRVDLSLAEIRAALLAAPR